MRGKKSYNIRNIEAHISSFTNNPQNVINTNRDGLYLHKNMIFQNNNTNNSDEQINYQTQQVPRHQHINEYINAKYGVSRYASNLVSGKMFRKI